MYELKLEEAKDLLSKLKKDAETVKKTGMRKIFSCPFVKLENIVDFCKEQNKNFYIKMQEEKERAFTFLMDKDEAIKAGWYEKKLDDKKISDWANKAYPIYSEQLWDNAFEQEMLLNYIRAL